MSDMILYNLNGTITNSVYESCRTFIEQRDPGLLAIKELTPPVRKRRLKIADEAMRAGAYHPFPINGIEQCLADMESEGIGAGIISNTGTYFITESLEESGLEDRMDSVYALYNPETGARRAKDESLLMQVASEERRKGNNVIGYVSHKEKEAQLSAKVYGLGILLTNSVGSYQIIQTEKGYIIKISNLRYLKQAIKDYKKKKASKKKAKQTKKSKSKSKTKGKSSKGKK
jgi:phosphoglycolate phosphatase-like HAD superfamily hydrolase